MADNRHFMLVVVGEDPDELIKKYDNNLTVDPYVVLKFSDAKKYHEKYIKVLKELLKILDKSDPEYFHAQEQLNIYENEDDIEFYLDTMPTSRFFIFGFEQRFILFTRTHKYHYAN